ncbi:hypothetical protein U6B65_06920 [Oscillospiraceae bacterium MB08-C2-2]|nr:hypothetical protein U6B65_06920 [Oscillospiraceae bacterium MB08-C2-2]
MKKIIFVSHCILNTASKVELYNQEEIESEEALRLLFVKKALDKGIQFVQLPCPEFLMYGAIRWGHVSDQFDNPFFRQRVCESLQSFLYQLQEYLAHPDKFCVLGIVGIDGSPSCGVKYTCTGKGWGGDFSGRCDLDQVLSSVRLVNHPGVFIEELQKMLGQNNIDIPIVGLFANEPDRILSLLD